MNRQPRHIDPRFRTAHDRAVLLLPTTADWEGHPSDAMVFNRETAVFVTRAAEARHGDPATMEAHGDGYVVWIPDTLFAGHRQYVRDTYPTD